MKRVGEIGMEVNEKTSQEIPDHVIESFARCLLPVILEYFDSDEGQREFEQWMEKGKRGDVNKS